METEVTEQNPDDPVVSRGIHPDRPYNVEEHNVHNISVIT